MATKQPTMPGPVPVESFERSLATVDVRLHNVPWTGKIAVALVGRMVANPRRYAMVTNLYMEEVQEGMELKPAFTLDRGQAQALMDELYRVGLRPSEAGTAGELEAAKAHLKDMRALVGKAMDLPEFRGGVK